MKREEKEPEEEGILRTDECYRDGDQEDRGADVILQRGQPDKPGRDRGIDEPVTGRCIMPGESQERLIHDDQGFCH